MQLLWSYFINIKRGPFSSPSLCTQNRECDNLIPAKCVVAISRHGLLHCSNSAVWLDAHFFRMKNSDQNATYLIAIQFAVKFATRLNFSPSISPFLYFVRLYAVCFYFSILVSQNFFFRN